MTTATDYTRQRSWFDPSKVNASATIVGCGGIGSFAGFALAKLGVQQLRLLDFDTVEEHNLPNQMFTSEQLGQSKVLALASALEQVTLAEIQIVEARISDGVPLSDVVLAAVDSMSARAELWKQVRLRPRVKLFLDGRLAGQNVLLYSVNPMSLDDVRGYEATLYSDDEALDDSCTARGIIDVGLVMASLVARAVRMHYAESARIPLVYHDQESLALMKGDWSCR